MSMNTGTVPAADSGARMTAIIGYILFLVGWPCVHMSTVAGVILAYIKRDDARGTIWESHFQNMIDTFWTTLGLSFLAFLACITVIGMVVGIPLFGLIVLWFLYRTIKGLVRAIEGRPY